MRLGSLFSGAAGLDRAVEQVFGAHTVWHSEVDPAASKVLAHHFPGIPNHGDITAIDWATVEPVDILCGGYPCQPFSAAGQRKGTTDERHLWPYVATAVSELRPTLCVFENVAGHLSMGFDSVLADLQTLRYQVKWVLLGAHSVGAPHRRNRVFLLAEDCYARRVHGRDYRRRGVHSFDGITEWSCANFSGGDDGVQGASPAKETSLSVRRQHDSPEAGRSNSDEGRELFMAQERAGCDRIPEGDPGLFGDKAGTGRPRDLAVRGSGTAATRSRQGEALVGQGEGTGRAGTGANDGTESNWPTTTMPSGANALCRVRGWALGDPAEESVRDDSGNIYRSLAEEWLCDRRPGVRVDLALLPTPAASRSGNNQSASPGAAVRPSLDSITELLPTPRRSDGDGGANPLSRPERQDDVETRIIRIGNRWGKYGPAIRRWEQVTRPAPSPTEPNTKGNPRLSAAFSEWMLGWPDGWVTAVPGISRNDQLRIVGNGVVSLQAAHALRWLLRVSEVAA